MMEEVLQKVEQIEIDPDSRYILFVSGMTAEAVQELKDGLRDWRDRDEKILVLIGDEGVEFRIEKVGDW